MSGQTKQHSFVESMLNVFIGYVISIGTQIVVFPWYGISISHTQHLTMGLCFMVVAIVRSYIIRRIFNRVTEMRHEKVGQA